MAQRGSTTFRTQLVASHVGLAVACIALAVGALYGVLGSALEEQLDERLVAQARGASDWAGAGRHPHVLAERVGRVVQARVTILDESGAIAGDSLTPGEENPRLEDLRAAPEVLAARASGMGHATRDGPDGVRMRFVAVPAGDGMVLRLGVPLTRVTVALHALRVQLLVVLGLALVAAVALGTLAASRAVKPLRAMTVVASRLAEGRFDVGPPSSRRDEFGVLAHALTSLATQLQARMEDLRGERNQLHAVLESMVEGVLVLDAQGVVRQANRAAHTMLAVEQLEGIHVGALPSPEPLRAPLQPATHQGQARDTEVAVPDGREMSVGIRPLPQKAGGGVVAVLHDLTRLRRLESMRRDFVANVSHELRTPVAAIQGFSETLLARDADAATQREFVETIHRHSARLGRLVSDLLTLSSLDAAPAGRPVEPVGLLPLVEHAVATLQERARQQEVTVLADVPPTLCALADEDGLTQVVLNLVDNAIKHGRVGGNVRVDARGEEGRVLLRVTDDGPGLAPEHVPRVFERFYRVDMGRSRDQGGTGLGLALVKGLVESMQGRVGVESTVGKGTTFVVDLKAA